MDDLFEQASWYLSEPRYHRLKFTHVTEALPEQEKLEVPSPTGGQFKLLGRETTQLLPGEEQQLRDEDEATQKVATPKSLMKYLQRQKTVHLSVPNGNSAKKGFLKQEQATLKVSARPGMPGQVQAMPERETQKVVMPPGPGAKGREVIIDQSLVELGRRERARLQARKAGASNFNSDDFDEFDTVPMLVLKGISRQQGSAQPAMKSEIKSAAGSAAYVSAGNIGGTILKYGGNLVIQRGFGAAAFGLYTLCMSVMTLIASIFKLGLDDAMLRYVSIYHAKRQGSSLRGLIIFCTALAGASGILGALVMLYYAPFLAAVKHSPEIIPILQMMSPMVPLLCLQLIWINGLQGFKEFKWRVLVQRILIPALLIVLLLGALIFYHNLNAIVIATVINAVMATIFSLFFFFRKVSRVAKQRSEKYELRDWFGFAAPNFLTSIIDTVLQSIDTILLAYFAIPNVALGQYAAAIKISAFIVMPQISLNAMFAPTIAELYSIGERQKLEAMFKIVTKWAVTFTLPIFGIATIFSTSLLGISGQGFVPAWPLVIAFSLGSLINVATGSVGYMLLMTGHTKISFLNSMTAVIVNIVLGIILAPRYGAMGVAIATGLAVVVQNLMRLLQVRLLLKMQPYRLDVLKPIGAALISGALTCGLLYLLNVSHLSIHIGHGTLSFDLALVPVFLALYFGILALFKVSPEDRIVLDVLRKKFRRGKKSKWQIQ